MNPHSQDLLERINSSNRSGATQLIDGLLADGMPPATVLTDVLDPAMVAVGKQWGLKQVSLSQAFVAAKIAEDILLLCAPPQQSSGSTKGIAVIGNIEDDFHSLGRRIVASFLLAAGWEVHDLGNDVPAEDFIDEAVQHGARVIGASAMMQTTALNIRKIRTLLDERGLAEHIKLAVGGAVFNWRPQLVEEVGGDGTVKTAVEVDDLFLRLQSQTHPLPQ